MARSVNHSWATEWRDFSAQRDRCVKCQLRRRTVKSNDGGRPTVTYLTPQGRVIHGRVPPCQPEGSPAKQLADALRK